MNKTHNRYVLIAKPKKRGKTVWHLVPFLTEKEKQKRRDLQLFFLRLSADWKVWHKFGLNCVVRRKKNCRFSLAYRCFCSLFFVYLRFYPFAKRKIFLFLWIVQRIWVRVFRFKTKPKKKTVVWIKTESLELICLCHSSKDHNQQRAV